MKVADIEVIELRVPGWTGETFDGSYDNCLVLVHTDEGLTGIAEVDSVPSVIRAILDAPRSHTHAMGLKQIVRIRAVPPSGSKSNVVVPVRCWLPLNIGSTFAK